MCHPGHRAGIQVIVSRTSCAYIFITWAPGQARGDNSVPLFLLPCRVSPDTPSSMKGIFYSRFPNSPLLCEGVASPASRGSYSFCHPGPYYFVIPAQAGIHCHAVTNLFAAHPVSAWLKRRRMAPRIRGDNSIPTSLKLRGTNEKPPKF